MVKAEFEGLLQNAPEGLPRTEAMAHANLTKPEAKKQPINLMDLIRLLTLRKLVRETQLPTEVLTDPQNKVAQLESKLGSRDERARDSARKEIEKILQTAQLLDEADENFNELSKDPSRKSKKDLGIVELAKKSTINKRSGQSSTELEASELEKNIYNHFSKENVKKSLRGERLSAADAKVVENETLAFYTELEKFAHEKLRIDENHPGLEAQRASFEEVATRVRIQQEKVKPKGSYTPALEYQRDLFVETKPDRLLQIRKSRRGKRREDEERLEKFRTMVANDFDPKNPKVKNKTIEELLEGIQTTASWRSGASLFADKKVDFGMMEEIDSALIMVEEGYLEPLAQKMVEKLNLNNDPFEGKVVDWLRSAINERRGKGKTSGKGSFEKGVLKWDELKNDVNNQRVKAEKGLLAEVQRGGRRGGSQIAAIEAEAIMDMSPEMMMGFGQGDRVVTLQNAENFLSKMGLDSFSVEQLMSKNLDDRAKIEAALKENILRSGLSKHEQEREFARRLAGLEAVRGSIENQRGGENLTFARLEKELAANNVQKYLWDLKAYFERVGPRESSSDWELAMIVRRAKEVLSRSDVFGGELGNNWGIWEQQLFGRGNFTEISSKEYGQRAPALLKQDVLYQSLSPEQQWMNGIMVHVKSYDEETGEWVERGEKKVLSTLSYYQMLRRDTYADMTLSSDVNSTDSMQQQVMLCLLYGDGTYVDKSDIDLGPKIMDKNGKLIGLFSDKIQFDFFDENGQTKTEVKDRDVGGLLGESLALSRWAEATWYYSLEWRKNNLDFNLDRYRRINKNILKLLSLEAYDGHYGPGEPGMREVLKAGSLLPDYFTYKMGDVEKSAVGQWLLKDGVSLEQAEYVSEFLANNIVQKVDIAGAKFNIGTLSVEDVRLKAREVNSLQDSWNIYVERENSLKNGRDLSDVLDMNIILSKPESGRSAKEKFFLEQAQLFHKGVKERAISQKTWKMLNGQADIITKDGKNLGRMNSMAVKTLAKRLVMQKDPTGVTQVPENVNWQWIFENFEYGAIMDYKGQKKQSDVMDFMGYFEDSEAVYGAMQQYAMCTAEWKVFETICLTLNKYQPAPEVERWALEALSQENKLRTNPSKTYEIPDSGDDFLTKYKKWKDPKTGKTWYLNDKDGLRVSYKKKIKHDILGRSHLKKTRELENYTRADIEVRAKRLFGLRILNKHGRERVLEEAIGNKFKQIALRFLWFDEPLFAFYELYEELKKYFGEVAKEVVPKK